MIKNEIVDNSIQFPNQLKNEIIRLKKEKNAIILGHFYQNADVQDISDFLGDSLYLAQMACSTDANIIVFAGVKFMAETAKIINPKKKVLLPDLNAGCSLSDSCNESDFKEFLKKYPDHKVITYINSSTEVKAMSDIICTSSNAKKVVESFPKEQKLIFAPDYNLGRYISQTLNREMVLWPGACHVHKRFNLEKILALKKQNKDALIISHPECEREVLIVSDFIGSTSELLNFTQKNEAKSFIVATESGIIHQMIKYNPDKKFIPAPGDDSSCSCNDCNFMKLITLEKIYQSLLYEEPEIIIDEELRRKAELPILRMLDISR